MYVHKQTEGTEVYIDLNASINTKDLAIYFPQNHASIDLHTLNFSERY